MQRCNDEGQLFVSHLRLHASALFDQLSDLLITKMAVEAHMYTYTVTAEFRHAMIVHMHALENHSAKQELAAV